MDADPQALRSALVGYVAAMHQAYLDGLEGITPVDCARLPLIEVPFTVAVVGTRYLHLVAFTDPLPPPHGPEVAIEGSLPRMSWTVRFFDPMLLPALANIEETDGPNPTGVREVLGASTVLYHLCLPPGSGLTPHHALHAGTGLVHSHLSRLREYQRIDEALTTRRDVVEQMRWADDAGLTLAVVALAQILLGELGTDGHLDINTHSASDARNILLSALEGTR